MKQASSRITLLLLTILSLSACTGDSYTELQLAAARGHTDRIEVMLNRGADVDQPNKYGKTALMLAAEQGHVDAVAKLIQFRAYQNAQDIDGMTALMFAAANGHHEAISTLLASKADPNITNRYDATALTNSVFFGHVDATKALLASEEKISQATCENALLIASGLGHTDIARALIDYGVDINTKGKESRTPIMAATYFGHTAMVEALLKAGADLRPKDADGHTVHEIAQQRNQLKIASLLEAAEKKSRR